MHVLHYKSVSEKYLAFFTSCLNQYNKIEKKIKEILNEFELKTK